MTMTMMMSTAVHERFSEICREVSAKGRGLTLGQLRDALALAEEEQRQDSDDDRVRVLRKQLGLEVGPSRPSSTTRMVRGTTGEAW